MIKRFSIHLQAYPQNIILLSERVLLTTQMEGDAGQRLHSVTVDLVLVNNRNTGGEKGAMTVVISSRQMFIVGSHVCVCYKTHSTFIQLCSDGFHQHGHRGGRARDVGGACVDHSCTALCAKHHVHPDGDAGGMKGEAVGNRTILLASE